MVVDSSVVCKCVRRGSGLLVYLPKNLLDSSNVDLSGDVFVRRYSSKKGSIILNFFKK